MEARSDTDRVSSAHVAWLAADALAVGGFFSFFLLGFIGLIPFALGFFLAFLCGIFLFPLDLMERRWLVKEFERLIRRPTWSAASGGSLSVPHKGHVFVFRAEGRLAGRFTARPATAVIGFDEAAFVALAHGPMLSRLRRIVIVKGEPADLEVMVNSRDCVLVERSCGLRLRLLAGSGTGVAVAQHFGLDGGHAEVADQLSPALSSSGWL